jgi:hypothetical protein
VAVEGSYENGLEDSNTVPSDLEGPSSMPSAKNIGDAKVGRSEEEILDILMFKFDEQIISHLHKWAKEAILKQEERVFAKVKGALGPAPSISDFRTQVKNFYGDCQNFGNKLSLHLPQRSNNTS